MSFELAEIVESTMAQAKNGDTVRIHYTGQLTDGTQFDSSREREPLQFTVGAGEIIPGLERQVEGMEVGTRKTTTIPSEEAYGDRSPERIQAIPRSQLPEGMDVSAGQRLQARTTDGRELVLVVLEASAEEVTVDGNHPLAGQDLVFDIELLEIVAA